MAEFTEEQKAAAQAAIETAQKVRAGGELKEGELLDFTSSEGNHYTGVLVFKKLTMSDLMKSGAIKSEILREAGVKDVQLVDNDVLFMAHVISFLEVALYKRPECLLKLKEITEPDLLFHVYGKYQVWEASFRKDFRNASDDNSEDAKREEALVTP
ncbi:hypothetical protein G9G53_22695 [Paenibacillus sp. EKM206P]|uniref:hypothetical protein n=1 Tax=Paenibacillus sp. EKM206P TaxID=1683674 RepID=UPI0013EE32D1|nr:hypothetical protein [Paenibacillus sp. EKM206P]KAF6569100.1 hypothetical protein G9G53_22695 [Paenibacillus sp. EKM206P]